MSANGDRNLDKGKKKRRYEEAPSGNADWARIDHNVLSTAIATVTATGCAIRFGYSRDGGAYAIGIVGDGDPYTVWGASDEATEQKLTELAESFAT